MDESKSKAAYAAFLVNDPSKPFDAALAYTQNDASAALRIAVDWANDPEVLAEVARLKSEGADIPSKSDVMRRLWDLSGSVAVEAKDRIAALKLFAEIGEMIPKATNNVNVTNNTQVNRVMVIESQGSDEDWQRKAARQQAELLNVSTSRH